MAQFLATSNFIIIIILSHFSGIFLKRSEDNGDKRENDKIDDGGITVVGC
jgi:hypothetical protein